MDKQSTATQAQAPALNPIAARVHTIYAETNWGESAAEICNKRMQRLFALFNPETGKVARADLMEALDTKAQGIPRNLEDGRRNPLSQELSETKRLYQAWELGANAQEVLMQKGTWDERLKRASDVLKAKRAESKAHDLRIEAGFDKAIKIDDKGNFVGVDAQAAEEANKRLTALKLEQEQAQRQREAERNSPASKAEAFVRRMFKDQFGITSGELEATTIKEALAELDVECAAVVAWLQEYAAKCIELADTVATEYRNAIHGVATPADPELEAAIREEMQKAAANSEQHDDDEENEQQDSRSGTHG